jgi:arsenate reductase
VPVRLAAGGNEVGQKPGRRTVHLSFTFEDYGPVMSFEGARERLIDEFEGIFSPETVTQCLEESTLALNGRARIQVHVPTFAERFTRERLRAVAQSGGTLIKEVPEVLFVCVHNAGRSQMAAALLDHYAEGRVHVRSAGSTPASEINPAVIAVMDEIGVDLS